jgi:hypothetical protein
MTDISFGQALQKCRKKCIDPLNHKPLSQVRFGELIGSTMGVREGYSGAAIHHWESGKDRIHNDDRHVLLSIVQVLHQLGGISCQTKADELLLLGQYAPLSTEELVRAGFDPHLVEKPAQVAEVDVDVLAGKIAGDIEDRMFRPFRKFWPDHPDAGSCSSVQWPEWLLVRMGGILSHWSSERVLSAIAWTTVWLLTWQLVFRVLDWPFANAMQAWFTIILYAGSAFALPFIIGGLTPTKSDPFWQKPDNPPSWILRLYTHQGAAAGYHVGFAIVFAVWLLLNYLGMTQLPDWLTGLAAVWPVLLGYAAARQVPVNLWRAYGRLRLADGGIFFTLFAFPPFFAWYFFHYYPLLLSATGGLAMILLTVGLLAGYLTLKRR